MRRADRHGLGIAALALVVCGACAGAALSEGIFRAYLRRFGAPDRFVRKIPGVLGVYAHPFWVYDERFGYTYPRGEKIHVASISGGRVTGCGFWTGFNEQGNVGRTLGDYRSADLRILVFGDSFTATEHNGTTWPLLLQERLTQRLRRNVHVVNFGRDGYGLLQMVDLAAAKIPEWRPHLAVMAFITNDLQRVRIWRAVTRVAGRWRYLVSPHPTPHPDPQHSYDTGLYHPEATPEWCRSMQGSGRRDRVLDEIEDVYQQGVAVGERRAADVFTLRHSYLLVRLRYGNAFRGLPGAFAFPMIQSGTYAQDARFMDGIRTIRAAGAPLVPIHLAFYPELREGKEYILNYQEANLLRSLEEVAGYPILETTRYVRMPVEHPERLIKSQGDYHPSLPGLQFYAEAVAEMLVRTGAVK